MGDLLKMRRIICNSNGARVIRAPLPDLPAGWVLVRTRYSMISIGTEIAPLRPTPPVEQNNIASNSDLPPEPSPSFLSERTCARARLLVHYLGKAARNPKKAVRKSLEIISNRLKPAIQEAIPFVESLDSNIARVRSEMDDQGWGVGYSASGEIAVCGEGVRDLAIGQAVACCGAGWANHAEYIALPRNMVCPVPKGCSLEHAASATIGCIALQGVRRADPKLGEKVLVLGLGTIGQITAQLLKASGCTVIGFDLSSARVEKSLKAGMHYGCSDAGELAAIVQSATDGFGVDKVLITAATKSNSPINQAMDFVREKGTVIIVGDVGLAAERPKFYRKEVNLLMSTSYGAGRYDASYEIKGHDYPYGYIRWTINRNMQAYMEQIARGGVNLGNIIERVVSVDDAPAVYHELAHSKEELPLGVLIEYPEQADDSSLLAFKGANPLPSAGGPARAALVGVGAYGTCMLVPKMQALPKYFTLVGAVSSDAVRGGNYARQMGLPLFSCDVDAAAASEGIDLLIIASRHNRHAEAVKSALAAGKHVFVEKPLAITWEELGAIEEQYKALAEPPVLMVGFNRRFSPAVQRLQEELANRAAPLMILYRINAGFILKDHWVQTEEGGGRNIGEACHMYDVFRSLTGAPVVEISAQAIVPEKNIRLLSDNFSATLRYADGSQATLMYTASGPKTGLPKERIEVFCNGEAYIIDDFKSLTRASDNAMLWQGDVDKGHALEFELLGKALAGESPSPISVSEIFETSAVALYVEDLIHGHAVD